MLDRFSVTGITPASRPLVPLRPGEVALETTQLADGQCTSGLVGFEIEATTPPPGAQIEYRNGSGDDIRWRLT